IDRLERIWPDLAVTVEGDYNLRGAVRNYAQAFRDSGVDVEHLPAEAAIAALRARPALTACVATALDHWVIFQKRLGEPEPSWKTLVAVARGLDPHPLRDRLRSTWGRPITPELQGELRHLAESVDIKRQNPMTIATLGSTLFGARLPDLSV